MKELINENVSPSRLFSYARENGLLTLLEDGVKKIKEGLTSIEEIKNM